MQGKKTLCKTSYTGFFDSCITTIGTFVEVSPGDKSYIRVYSIVEAKTFTAII